MWALNVAINEDMADNSFPLVLFGLGLFLILAQNFISPSPVTWTTAWITLANMELKWLPCILDKNITG